AVGLDADEVLAKYKAAGLLGGPEAASKPAARAPSERAPQASPLPPPPPEIVLPSEEEAPAPESAAPAPVPIEEAAKLVFEGETEPKLSPESRKRILAWTWRAAAALAILAAIIVFWPFRGPREDRPESGTVVSQGALPPPRTAEASPMPAAEPGVPPAAEVVPEGLTIEIVFEAETWIRVFTDGVLKVDGLFPAGATARARAKKEILIRTGNAPGFAFTLNGLPAKPLGRGGTLLVDVTITTDNYRDFLEDPPSARPAG
ncbi:MAG: DUF4115 domain-containing protein, partial [Candidatus Aminicenantes bacterium]|nr:DUF4115 domain-containing protein [Candidatus Aminicenantes bacterium]